MESIDLIKKNEREKVLRQWLAVDCGLSKFSLNPLEAAASFRRYFRLKVDGRSLIVMDAPPSVEQCQPYISIAHALRQLKLQAPEIFAANIEQGFLLMTDFGDTTYLKGLTEANAHYFYPQALSVLAILQSCKTVKDHAIPFFTADWMWREWQWHKEWFLHKLLKLSFAPLEKTLDDCFLQLVTSACNQPQVFMHRDYHSGNLMRLASDEVGILDFQDAFIGPVTYDLVSLLRDCYIDWPEKKVFDWIIQYKTLLQERAVIKAIPESLFLQWVDWMGIERHLKALFTFARKFLRDGEVHYLAHVPRTLTYLITISERYPTLAPLHHYFAQVVNPAFLAMDFACAR